VPQNPEKKSRSEKKQRLLRINTQEAKILNLIKFRSTKLALLIFDV